MNLEMFINIGLELISESILKLPSVQTSIFAILMSKIRDKIKKKASFSGGFLWLYSLIWMKFN